MILAYHGGRCCGIKTIYGMTYSPVGVEPALKAHKATSYDLTLSSKIPNDFNIYPHDAPAETGLERLDRYINYLKSWRPKSLVEINLVSASASSWQNVWDKHLIERGFTAVTTFKNSNTYNDVTVYHLVLKEDGESFDDDDYDDDVDDFYEDCDCPICLSHRESED